MASTTSTEKVGHKQESLSKHLQLLAASGPFQCPRRCNEKLPDWPATIGYLANDILSSDDDEKHSKASTIIRRFIENLFEEKDLVREKTCGCGGKNAESAGALKVVGNNFYAENELLLAIKFYSVAMAICPADVNLAVLYANRSMASARLEQYENAIEDIDFALKFQFPREKQGKLLLRKADCLLKLGRTEELAEFLVITTVTGQHDFSPEEQTSWDAFKGVPSSPISFPSTDLGKYLKLTNVIERLSAMGKFRDGNKFPWLSKRVKLVRDSDSGKFRIVTLKQIEAGNVLAIVKPFAVVSLDENTKLQKNPFGRCHHCTATVYRSAEYIEKPELLKASEVKLKSPFRINNPVSCEKCSDVLYCSDTCATEAWESYHQFECGHLPLLSSLGAEAHLALRVLYSTGTPELMHKLFLEEKESASSSQAATEDFLPKCARLDKHDDDFRRIFYSPQMVKERDSKLRAFIKTNVLLKLSQYSPFFKPGRDFVVGGEVVVRLLGQMMRNLVVVGRRNYRSLSSTDAYDRFQVATGLAALVEPAKKKEANVHLQLLNPLEIVSSNILLLTTKRSLEKGEKLSMDLSSGHFDTSAKSPVVDTELLGVYKK